MGRERQAPSFAQGAGPQEAGDPAAAGRVGLEDVDGAGLEHPPEIEEVVAVLARGDVHAGRGPVAEQPEALEVVGRDRLLEPAHASVRRTARPGPGPACGCRRRWRRRTARPPGPIASRAARTRPRSSAGWRPIFILTRGMPASTQPPSCSLELLDRIGREAAAAVDRRRVADGPEQRDQRQVEQARLQVPQRRVDGGDRHRGDAGPAQVADRRDHRRPRCRARPSRRGPGRPRPAGRGPAAAVAVSA